MGLIPENFKNYKLSKTPYSHPYAPWNENDKISCLILEKYIHNDTTQFTHNFKILLPKETINEYSQI